MPAVGRLWPSGDDDGDDDDDDEDGSPGDLPKAHFQDSCRLRLSPRHIRSTARRNIVLHFREMTNILTEEILSVINADIKMER